MDKCYFLTRVIMVPLYQLQGNLLILIVLAIQLSVLILNIMIFKIQFIHKCLQLLYLNSIQYWKDCVFFSKSCKFECRKIATMIFKSDTLITYLKEVKVLFSWQIQLADLVLSLHLSLGCIRGLTKSSHQKSYWSSYYQADIRNVPSWRFFPPWKADDFLTFKHSNWIRVVSNWGLEWEET